MPAEEFDRLEAPDEARFELDENELIEMSRPRLKHARSQTQILAAFIFYLKSNPVGEVFGGELIFILGPGTRRCPDVSFIMAERARRIDPEKDIEGAPDIAIEIVSPNDSVADLRRKIKQYFAAGARHVWIVYPDTAEVQVWLDASQPQPMLQATDRLEAPDLLPGFSIPVASLFQTYPNSLTGAF